MADNGCMTGRVTYGGFDTGIDLVVKAKAEFTEDMAETLSKYFTAYQVKGVVTLEVTNHGLWLINPYTSGRQFLGKARLDDEDADVL